MFQSEASTSQSESTESVTLTGQDVNLPLPPRRNSQLPVRYRSYIQPSLLSRLLPKQKISNVEAVRNYRARIKDDSSKYQAYLKANKDSCKKYRQNLSEDKKTDRREKAKLRMRMYRQYKKQEESSSKVTTRKNAAAHELQKAKWREEKAKQRQSLSAQKKRRLNEKRREKYADNKREKLMKTVGENSVSVQCDTDISGMILDDRNSAAKRQALTRARKALPFSPRKYVSTVIDLVEKASPHKAKLLTIKFPQTGPEHQIGKLAIKTCREIKLKTSQKERNIRRVLLGILEKYGKTKHIKSSILGMSQNTISRHAKRQEPKEKKHDMTNSATAFLQEQSTPLPDKKLVSKKSGQHASVLPLPLKEMHAEFCSIGNKISFSTFAKCRPKYIRTMSKTPLRQCLCEYCTNVELKIKSVNNLTTQHHGCRLRHIYHAVDVTTCNREGRLYHKDCAYRKCGQCGAQNLEEHLQPLAAHEDQVTWHRWESKLVHVHGKQVSRKMLVTKQGSTMNLIQELKLEVSFLAEHLFRAEWQHQQFDKLRLAKPFPSNMVGMVLDFADNFTCNYQEEVQPAHWHHEQVTVHPMVTYYACKVDGCQESVSESLVFISCDRLHDFHAVHHFTTQALQHLTSVRHLDIQHMVQWTDGCAAQYKSKGPFSDISFALQDFGVTLERNVFGSRHGKGPSNGEAAVVKQHTSRAVAAGRAIIAGAEDLYNYCLSSALNKQPQSDSCQHFSRTFFWVGPNDIKRNRNNRLVETVKGTRPFHCVQCIEEKQIRTRHLSCFCHACCSGVGMCENVEVTGEWQIHRLKPQAKTKLPVHQAQLHCIAAPPQCLHPAAADTELPLAFLPSLRYGTFATY